jgi:hypothetical protein
MSRDCTYTLDKVGVEHTHVVGLLTAHAEAGIEEELLHAEFVAECFLEVHVVFVSDFGKICSFILVTWWD